jgi:hypothetical protein
MACLFHHCWRFAVAELQMQLHSAYSIHATINITISLYTTLYYGDQESHLSRLFKTTIIRLRISEMRAEGNPIATALHRAIKFIDGISSLTQSSCRNHI